MRYRFQKHYTRDEARALLPQIREWLDELTVARGHLGTYEQRLAVLLSGGNDVGGEIVNQWVRTFAHLKQTLKEFQRRGILIKELDRGLIDFPAILGGKEVFLCWERGEEDIEFWHDLESGYAGRERLE
jgi:hypothetical protein